jgi:hypothetical protein
MSKMTWPNTQDNGHESEEGYLQTIIPRSVSS